MARLGDICEIVSGTTPKSSIPEYWDGDINWVTPAELNDKTIIIYESQRKITEQAVKDSSLKSFPAGTVLLSSRAPIGKVAIAGVEMYCNQGFKNLICSDKIHNKYLFWFLKDRTDYLNSLGRGATFKEISKSIVENIEIPLPSIGEQKQYATTLDKLSALISLRKQQLAKLEELVKARFVEMFGDPEINPMNWVVVPISDVINGTVSNGFFAKRDEYCENGNVQVLGVVNIVNRMYSNTNNLPKANGSDIDVKKYQVKYGDMLFCRSSLVAEGIGKASIVPRGVPSNTLFECHVIRLPLNTERCVPEFVQVLSTTAFFRKQVISQSKTATMTTISQDGILKSKIILPPVELQREFLNFIEKIQYSKLTIQQSLDKLELLKKSLMQEYFG